MTRKTILNQGSIALFALGLAMAPAAMVSADTSLAEAKTFLAAPGSLTAAVNAAETHSGGKAMNAEFEDDGAEAGMYKIEIVTPDGKASEYLVNPADNSVRPYHDD